jgi:hypothetical protein
VASRSSIFVFVALLMTGCDRIPNYAPAPVSPAELRNALPDAWVKGATIRTADGRSPLITWNSDVELPREPKHDTVKTSIGKLRSSCEPTRSSPDGICELDGRKANANVFVTTGYTYQPEWESVGRYALLGVLAGGAVAGEAYCFAECDSGGKVALVVTDVAVPLVAAIVVFAFIGIGLGNGG